MAETPTVSSLERYIQARGQHLVSGSSGVRGAIVQFWVGFGLICFAVVFAIIALLTNPEVALGAIGPAIAGIVNMVVSITMRKRMPLAMQPVTVTPEAKAMLTTLTWTYVWSKNPWLTNSFMQWGQNSNGYWTPSGPPHHARFGGHLHQSSLASLPNEARAQMEEAAHHYNRIAAALEAAVKTGNLARLAPKIQLAADESMLEVLHQSNLVSRYPEGLKTIESRLSSGVGTLHELADRVETLALREPTFTEMVARRSNADEVLDELRLEHAAFSELSAPPQDGEMRQNLQG